MNSVSSGYTFQQWVSDAGSFASSTSRSTTFTPGTMGGGIGMILYETSATNWAGHVMSTAGSSSLTQVSGDFAFANTVTYVGCSDCTTDNLIAVWVGLGGSLASTSSSSLWQAGILLYVHPGGTYTFYGVSQLWDRYGNCIADACQQQPLSIGLGDAIRVTVSSVHYSSGWYDNFTILDVPKGTVLFAGSHYESLSAGGFAEWIVEDPSGGTYVMPNYGNITFLTLSTSFRPDLAAPVSATFQTASNVYADTFCSWDITQTSDPQGTSGTHSFTVRYSGQVTAIQCVGGP